VALLRKETCNLRHFMHPRRLVSTMCLVVIFHFLQKSSISSGSFAKRDLQLEVFDVSSPRCINYVPCCIRPKIYAFVYVYTAIRCNALQRTATHCNALQRTATHCNALQRTATHCNALQRIVTRKYMTLWGGYNE